MKNHPNPLTRSRVRVLSMALAVAAAILPIASTQAALVAYWNFDESSGTTANDTSGRVGPLNGTLSASGAGAVVPARITGRFGNALDFNQGTAISAGGLVTVPHHVDLRLAGAFTISFWWRPDYVPGASTFPGIMRIGSQSAVVPAANSGWGFFRPSSNIPTHKRNNHQPATYSALTVGAWQHIALTHDGAGNNIAFQNGVMVNFTTNWPTPTTTAAFEMGRMDSFDNAGLDDTALFNETISAPKVRSLYTVPTSLAVNYDMAKMRQLWAIFDGGPGSSGVVDGTTWTYNTTFPGSTTQGDAYLNGTKWYVVLGPGAGLSANAVFLGDISPGGVGVLATQSFAETPTIGASARFVFDLGTTTTTGGGVNDLFEITGDLNLSGNSVVVNPMGPLANGVYRLFNYTGTTSGSFNPTVIHNSRYSMTLDTYTCTLDPAEDGGGARSGSGTITVSRFGNALHINGSYSGLSGNSTAAHIHGPSGPFPASAGVLYNLASLTTFGGTSGSFSGVVNLVEGTGGFTIAQQIAQLAGGQWYINVHSSTFGGGEIRGQALQPAGQVNLAVTGAPGDVKWNSLVSGLWDLTSLNWLNTATTMPDQFKQADSVTFDDSGAYQPAITLATGVFPSAMTVDSSTLNYSFAGSPLGGLGNGLVKDGTSTLTLSGANTFIGPITVNNGLLRIGNAAALGSTNSGTTIASGATLDLNNQTPVNEAVTVTGSGLGGIGAIVNNAGGNGADALRTVTLSGDAAFGGIGRWDLTGKINGGGNKLTKVGANEIWIAPVSGDTGLGDIEIQTGALGFEGTAIPALGLPGSILTIQSAGTLGFWALNNAATPMQKTVVMNGGTWRNDNGNNHFNGGVTLNGNSIMTVGSGATLNQLGVIDGGGSLLKNNAGTLVLAGVNTYSGATMVNAGTLGLLNSGSIAGSSGITLASGSTLNAATRTDGTLTLASGQTLAGSGTVHGNVALGTGTGISPGLSAGTLTVTNALSLSDATLTYEFSGVATEGAGVNDLINVTGPLNLAGTTTIKVLPIGALQTATPYTLINYSGALTGGAANFAVASDTRQTYTVLDTTPNKIQLQVAGGAEILEWAGGDAGAPMAWDTKTTANWTGPNPPDLFFAGDTVLFNDFSSETTVDLVGDLYPAHTRLENGTQDYLFTGAGRIRGGAIEKSFASKVTLANTGLNDYPGPTTINAGTLQVGIGGTAGSIGANTITNNGTLILNRSDDIAFANTMVGSGTFRKEAGNLLTLGASMANFAGSIVVNDGRLRPTVATGVGTAAGGITVNSGATLDVNGLNLGAEAVTVAGSGVGGAGALINNGAGQNNALRFVTLTGDTTVNSPNRWDVRANPDATFTGNGFNLTKLGANQFSLVSVGDTGLGDITVQQGLLSIEGTTGLGLNTGTVTVNGGATLMFWGNTVTQDKKFALNNGGRIFKDNGAATLLGTGTLTGSNAVEAASASGTDLTLSGVISGTGSLNKLGAGNVFLTANNDYTGETRVTAGNLLLGNGGTAGSVAGNIIANGSLFFYRSDAITLANNITGAGGLTIDGTAQVNFPGNFEVGRDFVGRMTIKDGANPFMGRLSLGNVSGTVGEVTQEGGNVIVATEIRVGHWPNNTSTYIMGGGTLSLTNSPTNPESEKFGILYVGVDGTGVFTQTGGVVSAHGIVLDNRGDTAGTDTFTLQGGTFIVGPSGIASGTASANTSYLIQLAGGTLASSGSWTSRLNMTINGDTTVDTGPHTNILSGALSGVFGLIKQGSGVLALAGNNTYDGVTTVNAGTLAVLGSLGTGFNQVDVFNGTLAGTGTISGIVNIMADGTLAPGLSVGTLTLIGDIYLSGNAIFEINKSGMTRTADRLVASTINAGGVLTIVHSGDPLTSGDAFDLFDIVGLSGSFTSTNLPALAPGLFWDLSRLTVDGTIRVLSNPQISTPSLVGNDLTLSGTGGPANTPYKVMASDEVTAPLASWVEVATGSFDASGNFSITFTINPADAKKFYSIQIP